MRNTTRFAALAMVAALAATPAMAQTMSGGSATSTAPATGNPGNTAGTTPADRNPVMTQDGNVRISKVIGSSVYNDHDEKLGSVDDVLVGKDGKLNAVLSVGGFLGVGTKYVEVPYANLTFGNTQNNSDNRVVLKGANKDSLKAQAEYHYYKS